MTQHLRLLLVVFHVLCETSAFSYVNIQPFNRLATVKTSTAHFMGKKMKPSMSERRKKRAKRRVSPDLETVRTISNDVDSDREQETLPQETVETETVETETVEAEVVSAEQSEGADEIGQKAESLLQSQRKVREDIHGNCYLPSTHRSSTLTFFFRA